MAVRGTLFTDEKSLTMFTHDEKPIWKRDLTFFSPSLCQHKHASHSKTTKVHRIEKVLLEIPCLRKMSDDDGQ